MPSDKSDLQLPDSCLIDELRSRLWRAGSTLVAVFRQPGADVAMVQAIEAACRQVHGDAVDGSPARISFHGPDSFRLGQADWMLSASVQSHEAGPAAIAYQPFTGEWFIAWRGVAWHSRFDAATRLQARRCASDAPLVVGLGDGTARATVAQREAIRALKAQAGQARSVSTAYGLCLVAMGQLDAMVDSLGADELHALRHIVTAAGGIVTDWCGNEIDTGHVLAAGCAASHERALKAMAWGDMTQAHLHSGPGRTH